ncbi:MAG: YbaB/EbfC family nucleoid-associated protein, partial [Thermocrispum sp.]
MSAEMEHLIKEFDNFQSKIRKAQEQFAGVGQMQEELVELEAVATSPDGSVRVVAGPGGAIKDIRLSQEALRQQAGAVSATIMATLNRAVAGAARKQAAVIDAHMGGLSGNVGEQVLQAQAEAFGVTVEDLRDNLGEQAPPPPAPPAQQAPPPPPPPPPPP